MNRRDSLKVWLIAGFALSAIAGPAHADTTRDNSDVVSRYLHSHASMAITHTAVGIRVPDVFERYAAAHPYGIALFPTTAASSAGFDWGDYGAGVGTGVAGFFLLAACWLATPLRRKRRTQPLLGRSVS